jgi:tRNA A37 N6-isopentenylltransferase MiaA
VSTTINELVDRRGGAYSAEELENVLNRARKILADTAALLELEIERYFAEEVDESDEKRLKRLRELIAQTQKGMQQILDIETKSGLALLVGGRELDLDHAREEIMRRIARITEA